jgi:hypothetical protein
LRQEERRDQVYVECALPIGPGQAVHSTENLCGRIVDQDIQTTLATRSQ